MDEKEVSKAQTGNHGENSVVNARDMESLNKSVMG